MCLGAEASGINRMGPPNEREAKDLRGELAATDLGARSAEAAQIERTRNRVESEPAGHLVGAELGDHLLLEATHHEERLHTGHQHNDVEAEDEDRAKSAAVEDQ